MSELERERHKRRRGYVILALYAVAALEVLLMFLDKLTPDLWATTAIVVVAVVALNDLEEVRKWFDW